jgi:alkylation response protein AidB-like acyl-CoA dehydrogenase
MEFRFTKEEETLLAKVKDFIKREVTPELIEETLHLEAIYGGQEARKFFKRFAPNGWLTPNWPSKYGGMDSTEMVAYLIRDEMSGAGLPSYFVGAYMAGPTILRFGSEEMKEKFLIPIARGEIEFALGYTEPEAGSDLMSLKTYAEDKGDHFVVNGQKIFNTACHVAEYHWLAVRTELDAPKHKGISMMVVDLESPGITVNPMITMAGTRTNLVYYDDVVVPKRNLVGELNKGGHYLMVALDFERMFTFGGYRSLFEEVVAYAKDTMVAGKPLSKDPMVRQKLAEMAIELEVGRLLYYQLPYMLDKGSIPNYQSSMEKLFVSELTQRISQTAMEVLRLYGQLTEDSRRSALGGKVGYFYRQSVIETIYGGSSEIQRNIMALRGLGLPRN